MHILKIRTVGLFVVALLCAAGYALPVRADVIRAITFPVDGPNSFSNDFNLPGNSARQHLAIDIIAKKMTPLVSAVDGYVSYVVSPQASWGYSISITDSDNYTYNYLHMNNDTPGTDDGQGGEANAYAPGITRGAKVVKGQLVGWVGDSGNAEETVSHLHFEIADPSHNRFNPYQSLANATGQYIPNSPGSAFPSGTVDHEPDPILPITSLPAGCSSGLGFSVTTGQRCSTTTYVPPPPPNQVFTLLPGCSSVAGFSVTTGRRCATGVVTVGSSSGSGLSLGASGEIVRQLQSELKTLGYFNYAVTGYFGPITQAAVVAFQTAKGIDPVGFVGPQTQAALNGAAAVGSTPPTPPAGTASPYVFVSSVSEGSSGEVVRQLQLRLKALGYYSNNVTGYFGPITRSAVVAFQVAKGIEPLGSVGPQTQVALNNSSQVVAFFPSTGTVLMPSISAENDLPEGTVGIDYSTKIYVKDGSLPYTWQIINGTLPSGLILGSTTGEISGIPTEPGVSNFIVKVADGNNTTATKSFHIRIQIR